MHIMYTCIYITAYAYAILMHIQEQRHRQKFMETLEEGECMKNGANRTETPSTIHKTESYWEGAVQNWGLNPVLSDNLEGWNWVWGWDADSRGRGHIYTCG